MPCGAFCCTRTISRHGIESVHAAIAKLWVEARTIVGDATDFVTGLFELLAHLAGGETWVDVENQRCDSGCKRRCEATAGVEAVPSRAGRAVDVASRSDKREAGAVRGTIVAIRVVGTTDGKYVRMRGDLI